MPFNELAINQSLNSARVFLNTFGLKLEEKNLIENPKLKIYNSLDECVGELYFDDDLIRIEATCPLGLLKASYEKNNYHVWSDLNNSKKQLFDFVSSINFNISKNKHEKYIGNFIVNTSIDNNGEKLVNIKPSIRYIFNGIKIFDVNCMSHNNSFYMSFGNQGGYEEIIIGEDKVKCRNISSGEAIDLFIGKEANKMLARYRMLCGNKVKCFGDLTKEPLGQTREIRNRQILKMMKSTNPSLDKKIANLREKFKVEDLDIINNFISICAPPEDKNRIFDLLGLSKNKMIYQKGSTKLKKVLTKNKNV